MFKGMVERCADCGFDLVGGDVEVVPTAHYMMGGVEFNADCSTAIIGLYAAGEDTGGVHGANRLGGNGVGNSTVFGGLAGDAMARWVPLEGEWRDPDLAAIDAALTSCHHPFANKPGNLESIREDMFEFMWDDAGILRDADSLTRATCKLTDLETNLDQLGVDGTNIAHNLTWHDWMNLKNLILVSRSIVKAAEAREDSRGAHFRTDFPETRDLENSWFTRVTFDGGDMAIERVAVDFSIVKPGETLLAEAAAE